MPVITDLPEKESPGSEDRIVGVDTSDTTESPSGTTKSYPGDSFGDKFNAIGYDIERASFTDNGFSDNFDGALKSFWDTSQATNQAVNFLGSVSGTRYDLSTLPGALLMQTSSGGEEGIRADFVPADGEQVVVALTPGGTNTSGDNNSYQTMINLNDDDSGPTSGNVGRLYYDGENNGNVKTYGSVSNGTTVQDSGVVGRRIYFRVINSGGTIYFAFSVDGEVWRVVDTLTNAPDNLWIAVRNDNSASISPISAFHWIRHTPYNGFVPF